MKLRQHHLLALGIIEYQNAHDHLTALRTAGVHVPATITDRLTAEHRHLVQRWLLSEGKRRWEPGTVDSVVAEAREWVTAHIDETEKLLRETG